VRRINSGITITSEVNSAIIEFWKIHFACSRLYLFVRSTIFRFISIMKRRDSKNPYFILGVNNTEIMKKTE